MRAWRRAAIAASGSKRMVTVKMTGRQFSNVSMTVVETNEVYYVPDTVKLKEGTLVRFRVRRPYTDSSCRIYLNDSLVRSGSISAEYTMAIEWDTTTLSKINENSSILSLYITTADYTP